MRTETVLPIREIFGENLLTPEDGERLQGMIRDIFSNNGSVVLDFAGVRIAASAFLNAAIGRLYSDLSQDDVRANLKTINLSDIGAFTLKRVVENSKEYYQNARFREAIEHAAFEA